MALDRIEINAILHTVWYMKHKIQIIHHPHISFIICKRDEKEEHAHWISYDLVIHGQMV